MFDVSIASFRYRLRRKLNNHNTKWSAKILLGNDFMKAFDVVSVRACSIEVNLVDLLCVHQTPNRLEPRDKLLALVFLLLFLNAFICTEWHVD